MRGSCATRYGARIPAQTVRRGAPPPHGAASTPLDLLGEHDEDSAGAADVGEPVHVLARRDAAQWVAAVPRGDLEGLVDVVARAGHGCMPISWAGWARSRSRRGGGWTRRARGVRGRPVSAARRC